jgi:hypothetical protein
MKHISIPFLAVCFTLLTPSAQGADPLVVHEWGTITTQHAANGTPQGRLNRISPAEVLPTFVHRFEPKETQNNPRQQLAKQPLVPGRPDVTMRLETPVLYFYPPQGQDYPAMFDVSVDLRGGVINEFYPKAGASVKLDIQRINSKMRAGLIKKWDGRVLDNYVVGTLQWRNLSLRSSATLPDTQSAVWLAPRKVRAASVVSSTGEAERYLFYRGVANLPALVQTEWSTSDLLLRAPAQLSWMNSDSMAIPQLWLADIRADGTVAFSEHGSIVIDKSAPSAALAQLRLFANYDYAVTNVVKLRSSMKQALITAGLFEDEAEAMLETWKESYFLNPGRRLFYVVPKQWIAYFLPLQISVPHELSRVLIGRIDFVAD